MSAVVVATVVVDQVSKAFAWRRVDDVVVNPGSDVVAPWMDATFSSSLSGALLDMAGVLVLTTASILIVRRCRDRMLWWAAALNIAGWTSNLLDRLGLHWLTAPGSRRGTVDWLYGYNVADFVIWTGLALALAWLGRELLRDLGWDSRRPRLRIAAGAAFAVVTILVVAGMTSMEQSTRPQSGSLREGSSMSSAERLCRDPAFALMPSNALLCAHQQNAAHPVDVASALTCPTGRSTATLHTTITNPNPDRSARFTFSAPGLLAGKTGTAPRGHIDPGGAIRLRVPIPRSTVPAALYLETAVQVWDGKGARWVIGQQRLWTTDLCEQGPPEKRTAQAILLCSPTGVANVALTPQPLAYRDDHQPVVVSWNTPMRVTTDASAQHPRSTGVTIDLTDRFLTVIRVAPKTATDVLVITGWGAHTIQHDGAAPARMVAVPVGRCLSGDVGGTPGG